MVSDEQAAGWKRVTDEVHSKGGQIFHQLFHAGRRPGAQRPAGQPHADATRARGPDHR
jgi:2,4-dienoyl-CoA reductase-like NADH-dependent reductase (Old Yellow Enzyme family)